MDTPEKPVVPVVPEYATVSRGNRRWVIIAVVLGVAMVGFCGVGAVVLLLVTLLSAPAPAPVSAHIAPLSAPPSMFVKTGESATFAPAGLPADFPEKFPVPEFMRATTVLADGDGTLVMVRFDGGRTREELETWFDEAARKAGWSATHTGNAAENVVRVYTREKVTMRLALAETGREATGTLVYTVEKTVEK